jgi:CubicO group peptidase (beta-lactamase class C family)
MRRPWLACLLCLSTVAPGLAAPGVEPSGLEREVDAYLQPLLEADLISGSVLIARGGEVELAKGYGPANREHGIACTADTVYRIASLSKSFTAMAVMILQERERLSVDDSLSKYVPDYPRGDEITLHHLLTHTSGVINYSRLPDHYRVWTMPHTIEQVIERFKHEPLRFDPGERFEYSNSGYVLLAHVIEKVSGVSFGEFLRENIFEPLEMHRTGLDSHTEIIPGRATGHYDFGEGMVQASYLDVGYTSGAGGIYSTVGDLFRWERALSTDVLVSEKTRKQIFKPFRESYGYGWFIREAHGRRLIEHRGGLNGFLSMMQRFVDDEVVVVTLFNYVSTFARDVNRGLAASALGLPHDPVLIPEGVEVPARLLRPLAGSYRIGETVLEIGVEDGKLWLVDSDGERSEAIPQDDTTFFVREANAVLHFKLGEFGKVERLLVLQSERMIPCEPVAAPEAIAPAESP